MIQKTRLYVVSQPWYVSPFGDFVTVVNNWKNADVLVFTGGSDVTPEYYQERRGTYTNCDPERDKKELSLFTLAHQAGKRFLGICRGAQFLTVCAGGTLIQHVTNHCSGHRLITSDPDFTGIEQLCVSSTHHQMMNPDGIEHKLIAWADALSHEYLDGDDQDIPHCGIEPEIVWYPKINALAIQAHPEIMDFDSAGVQFCRHLFKKYLCLNN